MTEIDRALPLLRGHGAVFLADTLEGLDKWTTRKLESALMQQRIFHVLQAKKEATSDVIMDETGYSIREVVAAANHLCRRGKATRESAFIFRRGKKALFYIWKPV